VTKLQTVKRWKRFLRHSVYLMFLRVSVEKCCRHYYNERFCHWDRWRSWRQWHLNADISDISLISRMLSSQHSSARRHLAAHVFVCRSLYSYSSRYKTIILCACSFIFIYYLFKALSPMSINLHPRSFPRVMWCSFNLDKILATSTCEQRH